jgi:single-stranded-DNA-specific exonuclease
MAIHKDPDLTPKRWIVMPSLTAEERLRKFTAQVDPILAQVLHNRGIQDYETASQFLAGETVLHNPMQMKDMSKAVGRIREAIRKKEPLVVYGDFDADGVTSTVLMVKVLQALGANVRPYIPHRVDEGYGLNTPALLQLASEGVKLVITVDCGVRSIDEVAAGQAAGLDIIITDHHSVGDEVPQAFAVINPKQSDCQYPEKMLAGVGIAYKLADALIRAEIANSKNTPPITTDDLLDLVALGTVADLAPLDSLENRSLVKQGLQQLRRAHRPGIYELLVVSGIDPDKVNAMSIGFGLGPRINAAGRLDNAMTAYQLLYTQDFGEASLLAKQLQDLNVRRQELTQKRQDEARSLALKEDSAELPLVFAASQDFESGIVGLVAGRLVEEFYRPAIVIEQGEEESRGSCRSIAEFNITEALDQCADLLLRHGGHAQAAGFSILTENIPQFRQKMMDLASAHLGQQKLEPSVTIDARISLSQASLELAQRLKALEPTGQSNEAPMFMTERLKVVDARPVGQEGKHLKLRLADGPVYMDAIAFRQGHWLQNMPGYIDVAYRLEINEWNGYVKPQLNVQDIRPS